MDTEFYKRIIDLTTFQQRFKIKLQNIYDVICEI